MVVSIQYTITAITPQQTLKEMALPGSFCQPNEVRLTASELTVISYGGALLGCYILHIGMY